MADEPLPVAPGDLSITGITTVIEMFDRLAGQIEAAETQDEVTRYLACWYRLAAHSHRVNLAAALEFMVEGE